MKKKRAEGAYIAFGQVVGFNKLILLPATAILAEASSAIIGSPTLSPLINLGAIGCMLAYTLLKLEPRVKKIEEQMAKNTRMTAFAIIAMKDASPTVKEEARNVLAEANNHD